MDAGGLGLFLDDLLIIMFDELDNTLSNVKNEPIVDTYAFTDHTFDLFDKL